MIVVYLTMKQTGKKNMLHPLIGLKEYECKGDAEETVCGLHATQEKENFIIENRNSSLQ